MDSPRVVDSGLIQMLSLVVDREKDSPLDVRLLILFLFGIIQQSFTCMTNLNYLN